MADCYKGNRRPALAFEMHKPHSVAGGPHSKMKTIGRKAVRNTVGKLSLRRVLVVEDDPILGMATEETLQDAGVDEVEICATTDKALEALKRDPPDAVILDVHLADRDDGWAIAELIETLGTHRPTIVFSTGTPEAIPAEIAELGSVLEKPYTPDALIHALRQPTRTGLFERLRHILR